MRVIKDGDLRLAIVISKSDMEEGLRFYSEDGDFVQVGTWRYGKGKKLKPHSHNVVPREVRRTQEVVHVMRGKVKASIYSEDDKIVEKVILEQGDVLVLLNGGHGYEILEDSTLVLETKNGPYVGAERDRRQFGET